MALVQSVVYVPTLSKWLITLDSPAVETDSFNVSVTHSSGFSGFIAVSDGAPQPNPITFTSKGARFIGITSFYISLIGGAAPPLSGTITLEVGGISGAWSYNLTPSTTVPPGPGSTSGSANPIDYSDHLDRLVTALDQLVVIETNIASSLATLAANSTLMTNSIAAIETQQTALVTQQTTIANKITALEARAAGAGIHTVSPWEWIGISSMVRVLQQTNVDLVELKNYVENNVPRTF